MARISALVLAVACTTVSGLKLFGISNTTVDTPHEEKVRLVEEVCRAKKALLALQHCKPDIAKAKEDVVAAEANVRAVQAEPESEEQIERECAAKKNVLAKKAIVKEKEECLPKLAQAEADVEEAKRNLYHAEHYLLAAVPQEHEKLVDDMCSSENRTQFFAVEQKQAPLNEQKEAVNNVCAAEKKVLALANCKPDIAAAKDDVSAAEAAVRAVQAKACAGQTEACIDEECAAKKNVLAKKAIVVEKEKCLPKLEKAKADLAAAERELSVAKNGYLLFAGMPQC